MSNPLTSVGESVPEITSSRCVTVTETTATLSFDVTDYPQLEGMSAGEFISSRIFCAGGYNWDIKFYPNGVHYSYAGYSSACLCYLSQANDVNVKFTMDVQGKDGQAPIAGLGGPQMHVFSPGEYCHWGYPHLIEKPKLDALSRLGDGCFTIRCIITIRNESPPLELPGHLQRLLGDGTGADVRLDVSGREFHAHRSLLAVRSPEFHSQFFGQMTEKDTPRVKVVEVEPTIFEMLLHYLYTDSLPRCEDEGGYNVAVMQHLMVAAARYRVDRLKLMCEQHLCDKINMDTITTMFALANQHNCKQLKGACLVFMASPEVLGTLLDTDGFKEHLMTPCRPFPLDGGTSRTKGSLDEDGIDPS